MFKLIIPYLNIIAAIPCIWVFIDYYKNFQKEKKNRSFYFYFILHILLVPYIVSSITIPKDYKVSQNTCKGLEQNSIIHKAVNNGVYTAHCLKKDNNTIIILGEAHFKGRKSKDIGQAVMNVFPSYAVEGANIEELPVTSKYFVKLMTSIVYPLLGYVFEESTIKDAINIAEKDKKNVYHLERGDLSLWDKEYNTYPIFQRDVIKTKRNLRMRDNLYLINKEEKLVVAIVGMSPFRGISSYDE
jgi:hypothetical protein